MPNLIAIDWSHTRGLTVYNGKAIKTQDRKSLLKKLAGESIEDLKSTRGINPASDGAGGESKEGLQSKPIFHPFAPTAILEQGCPLSLIYDILRVGCQVKVISNRATQDYRVEHSIEKTDENDARIIYELASNGVKLTPVSLDDKEIQLLELYQRYKRYQKARVALMNMEKGYIRQFGDGVKSNSSLKSIPKINTPSPAIEGEGESTLSLQSTVAFQPSPSSFNSALAYDIAIDAMMVAENSCLKKIIKLASPVPQSLKIKGLGPRLWAGIFITANPANFPTLSSYLRYCGLVNLDQLNHKWNRHARMLYHLLADETMRLRDKKFRPVYDQCKEDIATRHPDYSPKHTHNAALNRTATFLAKEIYQKIKEAPVELP